jgi:hypothetical protein
LIEEQLSILFDQSIIRVTISNKKTFPHSKPSLQIRMDKLERRPVRFLPFSGPVAPSTLSVRYVTGLQFIDLVLWNG